MENRVVVADTFGASLPGSGSSVPFVQRESVQLLGFFGSQVLLAFILLTNPVFANAHAALIVGLSAWAVLRWNSVGIVSLAAYVAACDVLWRMMGAEVPWELAKYIIVFLCLGGIIRLGRKARWNSLPLVYFLALLPSISVVLPHYRESSIDLLRAMSFNLSGPLSLFASAWFASQLTLNHRDLRRILMCVVGSVLAISVIALVSTRSAVDLSFTSESNLATSGGFGPNQVSVILGLGALGSILLALDAYVDSWKRWLAVSFAILFGAQSALTFSRGGLYSFAVALVPAVLILWRHRPSRKWLVRFTTIIAVVLTTLLLPRFESFTGGALTQRFEDTDPSHRAEIVHEDLRIWSEHPILGAGPGGARFDRRGEFSRIAHTEYSRLFAEHGLFGVVALLALVAMSLTQGLRPQAPRERAVRIALMLWSLASMLHVGMRVAAIGFAFGFACFRHILPAETGQGPNRSRR